MFGKPHTLFRLFGFEVRVDWSWFVILVLVVWTLGAGAFPRSLPGWSAGTYFWMALVAAVGLFASIVLHETSHAMVARRHGLPIGGITLFIFGGVAHMDDEPAEPKVEWRMALAGPAASAAIAALLYGALLLGGAYLPPPAREVLGWLVAINLIVLVFNLLPAFPLDGGRVLRAVLWRRWGDLSRATHAASRAGRVLGLLLIGLGIVQILGGTGLAGVWWILIGLFIRFAAGQGEEQVMARTALAGRPVRRFMTPDPVSVSPELTVDRFVEQYVYRHHHKLFPITEDDRLQGCVSTAALRELPRERWSAVTVREVAEPCTDENSISAEADAYDALRRMTKHRLSRLVVRDDDRLEGVVSLKDLMEFLSVNLELETESR
jgi:Zn-dependent protease